MTREFRTSVSKCSNSLAGKAKRFLRCFWTFSDIMQTLIKKVVKTGNIYLCKVNNKNTRKRCEICYSVSIADFEHVNVNSEDQEMLQRNTSQTWFLLLNYHAISWKGCDTKIKILSNNHTRSPSTLEHASILLSQVQTLFC